MSFFKNLFTPPKEQPNPTTPTARRPPGPEMHRAHSPNQIDEASNAQVDNEGSRRGSDSVSEAAGQFVPPKLPSKNQHPILPPMSANVEHPSAVSPPPVSASRETQPSSSIPAVDNQPNFGMGGGFSMFAGLNLVSPGGSSKPAASLASSSIPVNSTVAPQAHSGGSLLGMLNSETSDVEVSNGEQTQSMEFSSGGPSAFGFITGSPVGNDSHPSYVINNNEEEDGNEEDGSVPDNSNDGGPSAFGFIGSVSDPIVNTDHPNLDDHKGFDDSPDNSHYTRDSSSAPTKTIEEAHATPLKILNELPKIPEISSPRKESRSRIPKVIGNKLDEIKDFVDTFEENALNLQHQLQEAIKTHWNNMQIINNEQQRLKELEQSKKEQIEKTKSTLRLTEEQQSQAIVDEEYELADKLNASMEVSRRRVSQIRDEIGGLYSQLESLSAKREELTRTSISLVGQFIEKVRVLKEGNHSNLYTNIEDENQQISTEEDILTGLLSRARQVLDHVADDLAQIDEEKSTIDVEIKNKTATVQKEKEELQAKQRLLEMERDDLILKLKEKEKELKDCAKNIDGKQKEIDKAVKVFERDLRRLKETRERIVIDQENRQKEHNDLSLQKMAIQHKKQLLSEQDTKFADILADIDEKIILAESTVLRLQKYNSSRREFLEYEAKFRDSLTELQNKQSICRIAVDTISKKVEEIEASILNAQNETFSIDNKLPGLLADKKSAVTSKNFKKAAQVTKEIKEIEEKKLDLIKEIQNLESNLAEQKLNMEEQNQLRQKLEDEVSAIEREQDKDLFGLLIAKRKELRILMRDLSQSSFYLHSELTFAEVDYSHWVSESERISKKYGWELPDDSPSLVEQNNEEENQDEQASQVSVQDEKESDNLVSEQEDEAELISPKNAAIDPENHGDSNENQSTEDVDDEEEVPKSPAAENQNNSVVAELSQDDDSQKQAHIANLNARLLDIEKQITLLNANIEEAISVEDFDKADELQGSINNLQDESEIIRKELSEHDHD